MTFVAIDDQFPENKKVDKLHDRAFRFHVTALCYCGRNQTDGHVSARAVKVIAAIVETQPKRWVTELVQAKLWAHDQEGDGFWINDYLEYNPSAEDVKARIEKSKNAANKRWGKDATGNATSNAPGTANSNALPSPPLKSESSLPSLTSRFVGDDAHASNGSTLDRLYALARSPNDRDKVTRATNGLPEFALVNALEAAKGPAVRDRLGAALARLAKFRRDAA